MRQTQLLLPPEMLLPALFWRRHYHLTGCRNGGCPQAPMTKETLPWKHSSYNTTKTPLNFLQNANAYAIMSLSSWCAKGSWRNPRNKHCQNKKSLGWARIEPLKKKTTHEPRGSFFLDQILVQSHLFR